MPRTRRKLALPELAKAPKAPMPTRIKPMLATLVDAPFDRKNWFFEVKWDGYRAIAEIAKCRVRLYSRNLLSYEDRFAAVVKALGDFPYETVLDGEVVVLDGAGRPRFEMLQNYQ